MAPLTPGLQLAGRYTLERRLGVGGMAEVWSAFDNERNERVAVKALDARLAAQPAMVALLRNEYENVRRLEHPHIVRALAFHADAEPPFIVFELAEGGSLRSFVGKPMEALRPLLSIVDALAYAHASGVVHRDLKLGNVLVDTNGIARLTDFGIAAARSGAGLTLRTGGTPTAMSPQQLAREAPAPADDIYALGAMLYELAAGMPPFPADATPERVASEPPPSIPESAGLPAPLTQLISELLAKERGDRPAKMEDVAGRLRQVLAAAVTTVPPELSEIQDAGTARFEQVAVVSPRLGRSLERRVERPQTTPAEAWRMRLKLIGGAALVLLAAALVFIYLPHSLPPPPTTAEQAPAPPPAVKPPTSLEVPGPAPFELAKLARARDEAKEIVDRLVDLQQKTESEGAPQWAADDYAAATARAQAGDTMFKSQDYDGARKAYQDAEQGLEVLLARGPTILADALKAGWAAYAANDSATAIAQFQLAAKVDPTNTDAQRGLRRAQALDQVRTLLASADAAERAGDASKALATYREVSTLDPDLTEARDAIQRITAQIGRSQFDEAMSQGYAALDRGDASAARAAFTRARTLDPKSNAASDALAQVETRVRVGQFEQRQKDAAAAEAAEKWAQAATIYDEVLSEDPTLVFAQKGATHAHQMAQLFQQLDEQLAAPERLSSDAVYASAQVLVKTASALPGDELARKRAALEDALAASRMPVHVTLESDNATNVVLHQVDQLGHFTTRELDLRPGTYTAVGTRDGYRDVRRSFTVVAGQVPAPVVIRCEEKI